MAFNFNAVVGPEAWVIDSFNLDLGVSLLGTSQVVTTLSDKWRARITIGVGMLDISVLRAWKTVRRGRLIVDQIGPFREFAGSANGVNFGAVVMHDDGTPHDDGTGYSQGYLVTTAALIRATRLTVTAPGVIVYFTIGRFFGLGGRLYQITEIIGSGSTMVTFDFWPPLRAAVASNTEFDWPPQTLMKLVGDDEGEVEDVAVNVIRTTINLIEVL